MTSSYRIPPGRAGRLWLRRRIDIAERGHDLLERKLRILHREHERLALRADRTEAEWTTACRRADTWLLRAALAGGRRSLCPAPGLADVTITWRQAMGTRYPEQAVCALPAFPDTPPCSAALVEARDACRAAVAAAARYAAARAAERVVAGEITATRRRVRALERRWIPRLTTGLSAVELALDEGERIDRARLLRASAQRTEAY
ncbi:V-type ATP synthase subunit D [Actinoallomurus soli]|uniref:V-type ATP synthase subunit D n=1 Tax=Actinoallomurus soli TaxID=2952535 RepID=UPI0020934D66|nr:V-type ATP synthase subunit D [Actinoallomurus soli]MCO5967796.1 V-type ATP synthase subunit D [Actinoallomurus soli]